MNSGIEFPKSEHAPDTSKFKRRLLILPGGSAGKLNSVGTDNNSGHEDVLRARFREQADGNYRVVFTGRFAKIIPFRFATTLNVVGHNGDKVIMEGESRIMGFSRFSYHAVGDANQFNAQYESRRWRGEFNLSR